MRPSFLRLLGASLVLVGCGDAAVPMELAEIERNEVASGDGGLDAVGVVDAAMGAADAAQASVAPAAKGEGGSSSGQDGEGGFAAGGSGGASSNPDGDEPSGELSGTGGDLSGTGGVAGDGSSSEAGAAGDIGEEPGVGGSSTSGGAGGSGGSGGRAGVGGSIGGGEGSGGSTGVGGQAQGGSSPGGAGADDEPGTGGSGTGDGSSFSLAVIGSSTAAGDGASAFDFAWVGLLDDSLRAAVTTLVLENLATGGYTSTQLLPGSGSRGNIDDAIEGRPDLIIVALAGSNDLSSGTTTEQFMARLTVIRDAAFAAGIPVFFVSTAPKDIDRDQRETLELWARNMGESFGACPIPGATTPYAPCFIDIFHALANSSFGLASEFNSGDGIHLNDAGHARIFQVAEPIIKPYVCSRTTCR